MVKGNLLAVLSYVKCGQEWSDAIESFAKEIDTENKKPKMQ